MANLLGISGAQPNKPSRFAPVYTGRWSSGIWTNRSPLRDANTTRLVEKFYGPAGDALIAGLNTEITNRLTLARRPGNSLYDANNWGTVQAFGEFHLFNLTQEVIYTLIDQTSALYYLYQGVKTLIWTKSTGAGQTYFQAVGNTLYFGNGIDQKKWLQTLVKWQPSTIYFSGINGIFHQVFLRNCWIVDSNGNIQQVATQGTSGPVQPTWSTTVPNAGNNYLGGTTNDGTVVWLNRGPALENWGINPQGVVTPPYSVNTAAGTLTTANGGWRYTIALVNSKDNTVSNAAPLSGATGNHANFTSVVFAPGAGINTSFADPQADLVAIFRTTDGGATPFLIPSSSVSTGAVYTVDLNTYMTAGFSDIYDDGQLNNQIQAPLAGENTPPAQGAINLTYHLNRIFYSIGNVVYWTSGPDTPAGNGVNGTYGLNFQAFPSLVVRIQPTGIGALVFTVSDTYAIGGLGTATSPIQSSQIFMQGLGLANYNALDIHESVIGLFTTDKQFLLLDPSSGFAAAGFPIGDQFKLNNGQPGQSWDIHTVRVIVHVDAEDHAFYVGDFVNGWYRLMTTPAPETGYTWSPFAQIVGGCSAIANIETTPGVHKLLIGPRTLGPILMRDYNQFTDNNQSYNAYAIIGSAVLCQPGQIAALSFITTDAVKVGTPLELGVILDEALPYYIGPFDILKSWVPDPPDLQMRPSSSIWNQRFYMAESESPDTFVALCRHMQISVNFNVQAVQNELLSLTVYGTYSEEN